MPRSLRSRLIIASVLWTAGLLAVMHMLSLVALHTLPALRESHPAVPVLAGLVLMGGALFGARQWLAPFRRLRERLVSVRIGTARRVEGVYPTEIQPLIDDLNSLLEDRERSLRRALATAGDLAHGLKTPLAVLAHEADLVASAGHSDLAENIDQQVQRMSRQVNYHLARARAASSGTAGATPCPVAPRVNALIRTLTTLYADRRLEVSADIFPDPYCRVQPEDFDEILGNLLDNACKWAKSRVLVQAFRGGDRLAITVEDDGPGLQPSLRSAVLERGVRMDENTPGSGLGLAIVRDLAELYGGSISLDGSRLGGLCARVTLPTA
jgi:signal transduction histidine kinase